MNMRSFVADRVAELQELDAPILQSLPPQTKEILSTDGKTVITQYHEVSEGGEHKVVVQAMRHRWLGLSTAIEVDGFVVASSGARRPLTDKEKWPFL